ncbi:MAG: hypothetical protein IKW00_09380 [Clostridia bacterium]|nr:hypothetical protein [Clostridia bacterium]
MKHLLWKLLLLTAVLCLFMVLSAQAALGAELVITVDKADDLYAVVEQINAEGAAAYAADKDSRMERVNLVISKDITLTKRIQFDKGTNVHIYSTPGKQFTIKGFTLTGMSALLGDAMFDLVNTAYLKISNIIIDGDGKNASFLKMSGAEVVLGENLIVQNFDIKDIRIPFYSLIHAEKTGLYNITPKITIKDSKFLNNKSPNGGVLRAILSEVTIENSLFEGNTAVQYPSGVKMVGEGGGALHLKESTATIKDTQFIGNKSEISGGAVQAYTDTTVVFDNCIFSENEAVTHGGAICVSDSFDNDNPRASKITLNNCTLTGNKSKGNDEGDNFSSSPESAGGGAIFLHEYCEAYLNEGTVLSKNESADEGGAIFVSFGGKLFMNGAEIRENKAATDGGGVYLDGTDAYSGYPHNDSQTHDTPVFDDGFAAGGQFFMTDGLIYQNVAGGNGGGVYIGGENEVEVDGEVLRFVGGEMQMSGGVITENHAMDMGGGIFVGSSGNEDIGGIFEMTGGTVHENIAGQDGNTSTGLDDAGAEIFSVGYTSYISVVNADRITAYIRDRRNAFVPESHRSLYYEDWYDDYSDQDPEYGKAATKIGTGVNTGRYTSSIDPDRIVYTPLNDDNAYNALILGYKLPNDGEIGNPPIPETGDRSALSLYAALLLVSAGAYVLMRKRGK